MTCMQAKHVELLLEAASKRGYRSVVKLVLYITQTNVSAYHFGVAFKYAIRLNHT